MLFVLLLMTFLSACSANEDSEKQSNEQEKKSTEEGVNVDKGLLTVEATLPASMFEGEDIDTVISEAKADGVSEVTKNADGSVTYKMSKAKHKELMNEIGASITESIDEMKNGEDFVSIKDVSYNKSFSEFTLLVDKEAYDNSFDGFAVFGLGLSGAMYQLFNGADPDDYKVTILVKDEITEEIFSEVIYPDDLEEMGETE